MKLVFFIALLAQSTWAFQLDLQAYKRSDWDSLRADVLAKNLNSKSLLKAEHLISELKAARELCSLQLRKSLIPYSCFSLLDLERANSLLNTNEYRSAFSHLEEVCVKEVGRSESLILEKSRADLPKQSLCLRAYHEKLERLRYGSAFRAREEIFEMRHRF